MGLRDRIAHAWNAFMGRDPTIPYRTGYGNAQRPDRARLHYGNERSFVGAILNRIALDCAAIRIEHVQLDNDGRYEKPMKGCLNDCFNLAANADQTSRAFFQDVYMSLMDEGCIAIVPTDCDTDPSYTGCYDIYSMRVGRIKEWFPDMVRVEVFNEAKGQKEEVIVRKSFVAIVENPFYQVMNQYNSTLQRLIRKLNLLDNIDEQSASGKLDLIIQLPYPLKSPAKKALANERLNDIETQLKDSQLGIAYIDATEHVTQLNRAIENKLFDQIEYYTNQVYSQFGITPAVLDGTAKEEEMLNYYNRAVEPIVSAVVDAMKWKFLTTNARSRGQSIFFFHNVFKLVPANQMADIADKFTRNEILSSNEVRGIIGFKPSKQEGADELRNKNLNKSNEEIEESKPKGSENKEENQNGV